MQKIKNILALSIFLGLSVTANALTPSLGQLQDEELIDALQIQSEKHHHSVGYKSARRHLFGSLYLNKTKRSYTVTDVYCEDDYRAPGPYKIPNSNIINTEHTWPQSKFGGHDRGMQKSDLHHLFPTDSRLNSIRGNHAFGVVVNSTRHLKCPESKIGRSASGRLVFEPPHDHKGNVARALFYFSVRYGLRIDHEQEEALRLWNVEDPVDEQERILNEEIEDIQGNLNPFINHPEYVEQIDNF